MDKITLILEGLYLDNRDSAVRGDYKEFIAQAHQAILDLFPKERFGAYAQEYADGWNAYRKQLLQNMGMGE